MENKKPYDLQERLIVFAINIISIVEHLDNSKAANHIGGQLLRSGTSPALHYGEAQSAESRMDFIHKLKVILKELRETNAALIITERKPLTTKLQLVKTTKEECNELISIFMTSISTAKKNLELEKKTSK
jgi:four helix bundle protein